MSIKELIKIWAYVAAHSFGGPAGQIAVIHKLVVEDKKIISEDRFLHALNFCMLLPGPEAQQLATYLGWIMHRWVGGLIAGILFILPGFLSILALSYLYILYNDLSLMQGLFYGIKPAIIAIVIAALYRISNKSLKNSFYWGMAFFAFIALFFFNLPFPLVIISAGIFGFLYGKLFSTSTINNENPSLSFPSTIKTIKTIFLWAFIWILPILLTLFAFGEKSTLHTLNIFFSKMSLLTFGGAYAALSYVAQQAVDNYAWLQGTEMLDGLALAETTPGPLIQVLQYVGFMGSYRFPGSLDPMLSAFIGSFLTTWMTFVPCFLFIFSFAPYIEFIRGNKIFTDMLSAVTASVVGVILNLSIWFIFHALFLDKKTFNQFYFDFEYPVISSIDIYASIICLFSVIMHFKFKRSIFTILGSSAVLGVLVKIYMLK